MTKNDFVNIIVCKYWFDVDMADINNWDVKMRKTFLSGMHRTWNTLFPSEKIEPLEIHRKITTWSLEQAQQWYAGYISNKVVDGGRVKNRFQILDLSKDDSDKMKM